MSVTSVKDISVLALYVKDMGKSQEFYRHYLGFEKCQDMEPGVLMQAGQVTIYLEEQSGGEYRGGSGFCPCFETESIRTSYEALREAGVTVKMEYREFGPSFAMFRIADPDGNLIEFAGAP